MAILYCLWSSCDLWWVAMSSSSMPVYLSLDELAAMLKRSPTTILNDRVRNPRAVPPAIRPPGTKTLIWEQSAVVAWLAQFTEAQAPEPAQPRRRGRPRKQG
ncbi:conserved hypothetical protein [Magnetospirillum sp. LM-5]|nr:conserved hypothetical protein [Magnetospirillum sp. LM-5]